MQVACGNCQLTFDAPEGTTGLVCPICRNPLQMGDGDGTGGDGTGTPGSQAHRLERRLAQRSHRVVVGARRLGARRGHSARRRHGHRRGAPRRGRRLGLDLRRASHGRRPRQAPHDHAGALPRRTAAPAPEDGRPRFTGARGRHARRPPARAPHALLRGLRHHVRDRGVARQRDGARRLPARRDQRRHRGRHRRARAPRRGHAVGLRQLSPQRASDLAAHDGSEADDWRA